MNLEYIPINHYISLNYIYSIGHNQRAQHAIVGTYEICKTNNPQGLLHNERTQLWHYNTLVVKGGSKNSGFKFFTYSGVLRFGRFSFRRFHLMLNAHNRLEDAKPKGRIAAGS